MGQFKQKMIEDLQLRRYAPSTCGQYVAGAEHFVAYHMRPPTQLDERDVRRFLLHLVLERRVGAATQKMHIAGIKFLYEHTLGRPEVVAAIPWPKVRQKLPDILSGTEVDKLLEALESTTYRAIVMTAYAVGRQLRVRERRPRFLRGPRATAALATLARRYEAHGAVYIALNRFVPALRAFFFVAAGISGVPAGKVAVYGLLSALVWNAILLGVGTYLGSSFAELEAALGVYGAIVLTALGAMGVVMLGRFGVRRFLGSAPQTPEGPIENPSGPVTDPQTTAPGAEAPGADDVPVSNDPRPGL